MGGVFGSRNFEQSAQKHDTELTLTPTTLLVIVVALVALCGLCFGLGYSSGRHSGAGETAASPTADGSAPVEVGQPKPAADMQSGTAKSSAAVQPDSDAATTDDDSGTAGDASTEQPQVKPALGAVNPAQAGQVAAGSVGPALGQTPQVMVQIAAVGQQGDADVLVGALRRRGYAVGARREPLDGLIHVKIGPFKTVAEADTWRQKLMNDGYNAEVQQ